MFDSEVKKLWEAFHSIIKQINQPPKLNNEEDFRDIPNVSTSNRLEQLSKSKETKLSDQKKTKTVSVNSKDKGQLKIQALEKKLHELEHQLQVKETVIKNLASTNEHLMLKITNLRKRSNLEQPETKKIMTTSACATTNTESSNSAKSSYMKEDLKEKKDSVINHKSKRKPQVFIVGDSMNRDLKGWLMARDKAVKVYTFPGASCKGMENYLVSLMNRKPDQILLHVGTNNLCAGTPTDTANKICHLATRITSNNIRCAVSTIIRRGDYLATKGEEVNRILSNILPDCIKLVSNDNLNESHLNRSKLHLNKQETGAFAHNIIQFLRSLKLRATPI